MPQQFAKIDREWGKRCAAWEAHYRAKGCCSIKAAACARRKRFTGTWPAEQRNAA